jgi:hypothetical protein
MAPTFKQCGPGSVGTDPAYRSAQLAGRQDCGVEPHPPPNSSTRVGWGGEAGPSDGGEAWIYRGVQRRSCTTSRFVAAGVLGRCSDELSDHRLR